MTIVSDVKSSQPSTDVANYDAVVVGAGPYGLTIATHLMGKGLNVAIFGKPLELWREHMPEGMFLRSHWWATSLSDPQNKYSFERFFEVSEYKACYPVPIQAFIDYGLWFQKHAVPNVDETYVKTIERVDGRFLVTLEDGRQVISSTVVMAIGVYYYANIPAEYAHLPKEFVSHSFEYKDFDRLAGKHVLVIGAGQSAVENTALMLESGVSVSLVSRHPIYWLGPDTDDPRPLLKQLKSPTAGIASGWKNWALEHLPYLFKRFPRSEKDRFLRNHYIAAASHWLRDRVIGKAELYEGQKVEKMQQSEKGVEVQLSDGKKLEVDHVMLGTGYQVSLKKLPMLHPSLASQIQSDNDIPELSPWFESSVPGLYFVGLSSIREFGPLYRFVLGNTATAQRVAGAVARRAARVR